MEAKIIEESPNIYIVRTEERDFKYFITYQGALAFKEVIERKPNESTNK